MDDQMEDSNQSFRNMRRSAANQRLFMKQLSRDSLEEECFDFESSIQSIPMQSIPMNFMESDEWPPKLETHPEFCWSHQFLHGRSDWVLKIQPMPPDLTNTQILSRARLPIYIDHRYFHTLGARYNLPEDQSPILRIDLKKLQDDLSELHNRMGKVTLSKIPEPKVMNTEETSYNSGHWEDLCKEMKEFQDLVLDEHREKRRKYKMIINSCQKYVETKLFNIPSSEYEDRRASSIYKNICSLIEVFWSKIERIAWESIKSELNSQLIEQKRKRLNKFVKDAMEFVASDRNSKCDGSTLSPMDTESSYDKNSKVDLDEFDINNKEFKRQRMKDEKYDLDMETDSEDERKNELDLLQNEAEMDINELIQRYKNMSGGDSEGDVVDDDVDDDMGSNPDTESRSSMSSERDVKDRDITSIDLDEFDINNKEFKRQRMKDEKYDLDMETDSEDERKNELDLLQNEAEMDINELIQRYKNMSGGDSEGDVVDDDEDSMEEDEGSELESNDDDLIPVPHLIRATLRSYQHQGLTWLAKLHDKGTNGILADEMGLGKTLQTISLLAHLACHLGKWGPHLIIVPNSLLINWEMEFKKFCPGFKLLVYYGSANDRAKKRVGWNKPYLFNVCITSYAIAVQDAHILKRKNWQYMVLDEAQNIKNFESKRWSTLLTFNSDYRILLTGTPLQNSIQELWSLMHFILPDIFSSHSEFKEWFGDPITAAIEAEQIAGSCDPNGKPNELVTKLHCVLRPYMLRRLKKDVEKQMPSKYEHVIKCILTRRQRTLYDEFMTCASTSDTVKSGTYHGVLNIMMQLRKICNHPDQLNPRSVKSPLNIGNSCVVSTDIPNMLHIYNDCNELKKWSHIKGRNPHVPISDSIAGYRQLTPLSGSYDKLWCKLQACKISNNENMGFYDIKSHINIEDHLDCHKKFDKFIHDVWFKNPHIPDCLYVNNPIKHFETYKKYLFRCNYNAVVDIDRFTIPYYSGSGGIPRRQSIENQMSYHLSMIKSLDNQYDFLHRSQALILPPKSALHDDCGKFHILGDLLERLKREGHRCLLYTQFSKMLDILESWICSRGYIYVRLDGKTKVDQRQRIVTRFNENPKIFLFISSTRAGGIGLNLTGADTVIFYDTDWNPAMDRQAMDRCHRIGQTKDVNVYRLISEYTVEENIWHKQLIKRKLDDVVVDQGKFSGEMWFNNTNTLRDMITTHKVEGDDEELYGKRVLHESELPPQAPIRALKLMSMVEDVEDKIIPSKKEDRDLFGEKFTADTFDTIPALVTFCVKFLKRFNTPNLSHLINEFQIKIDAESGM